MGHLIKYGQGTKGQHAFSGYFPLMESRVPQGTAFNGRLPFTLFFVPLLLLFTALSNPVTGQVDYSRAGQPADQSDAQTTSQSTYASVNPAPLHIKGDFKHFELDKLGNLFLISQGGSKIIQYDLKGDSINHYDNISSYGAISELDVANPLKIAVYYRDYATIVVLDRFLSPVNTIDLRNAGIWEAQTIATSYDNQYWVYDKHEAKIKKINGQGKVTFASNDLRQVFDDGVDPIRLIDRDGWLYAYDPGYGWYIFDYYGALNQRIPAKGLKDIHVTDGVLTARIDKAGQPYLWIMDADPRKLGAVPLEKPLLINGIMDRTSIEVRQSMYLGRTGELLLLTDKGFVREPMSIR